MSVNEQQTLRSIASPEFERIHNDYAAEAERIKCEHEKQVEKLKKELARAVSIQAICGFRSKRLMASLEAQKKLDAAYGRAQERLAKAYIDNISRIRAEFEQRA